MNDAGQSLRASVGEAVLGAKMEEVARREGYSRILKSRPGGEGKGRCKGRSLRYRRNGYNRSGERGLSGRTNEGCIS